MTAIIKREFKSYFTSPTGYIFLGMALLISGWFFFSGNLMYQSAEMSSFFGNLGIIFIFLVPMLTMRLIAEDRRNKTDQILLTSPVSVTKIVFGKYFAAAALFGVFMLILCIYPIIMAFFGTLAVGSIISLYIGFFLLGCSLLSVGLFVSSLTESQITSAIISFSVMLVFWFADWIASIVPNTLISTAITWLSVLKRFDEFTINILNLSTIVYYLSFSFVFVFITIQVIERKRWI